jgi:general secretion pathway protein D
MNRTSAASRFAFAVLLGTGVAQDPPQQQQPAPQPRALVDPTVLDAELQRALGTTPAQGAAAVPARPALPNVQLKALVAAAPDRLAAVIALEGTLHRAAPGALLAAGARSLRVASLESSGLVLADETHGDRMHVDVGVIKAPAAEGRLARVDFRGVTLDLASRVLADLSGMNIAVSASAAAKEVSLYLTDVDAIAAIRILCEGHQLWWRRDAETGIVRISTAEEYERDVAELQEERTESFTLHYPNVFDVGRAIRDLYGDRVVMRSNAVEDDSLQDLANRLSRFDIFDGRTQGFGQSLGVEGGAYGAGGYAGRSRFGSGYGTGFGTEDGTVLPDYGQQYGDGRRGYSTPREAPQLSADQIQRLEQLLSRAAEDRAAAGDLQREVARRYRAPIYVTMAPRQNKVIVRTSDLAALDQIREVIASLDVPTSLVLLEVRVLAVDDVDGFESFFEYQWADGRTAGEMTTGTIAPPAPGSLGVGGAGVRTGDLLFQYVDSRFAARLQILERDNRIRSLATPILLTANNEVSRLFVGQEVPLNRSFVGGTTNQNESTTTTAAGTTGIEFRPVGTTLLITPSINSDRTVTLQIVQETSNVNSTADVLVPDGDTFVSTAVNIVSSQTVSGTIIAKSDLAVAFGGLVETGSQNVEEKVPFLGDIPLLGILFRREVRETFRREIVVVVKPYVIGTPAEQATRSARMLTGIGVGLDDLERKGKDGEPPTGTPLFHDPQRPRLRVHGVEAPGERGGTR